MADHSNDFQNTVESLFTGMEGFLTSKTVVGEPIRVDGATILPLMDVSFGAGAGANQGDRKNPNAGGGIGGKMTPSALLIISGGTTKLVNVKNQDSLSKIMDMLPDVMSRFTNRKAEKEDGCTSSARLQKKNTGLKACVLSSYLLFLSDCAANQKTNGSGRG